jgi:hypothetical protein
MDNGRLGQIGQRIHDDQAFLWHQHYAPAFAPVHAILWLAMATDDLFSCVKLVKVFSIYPSHTTK